MDVDANGKKPAKPYSKKSHMIYLNLQFQNFTLQNPKFPNKKETLGVAQRFGCGSEVLHQEHH